MIAELPEDQREAARPEFAIFVVHNKLKEKAANLPENIPYAVEPRHKLKLLIRAL